MYANSFKSAKSFNSFNFCNIDSILNFVNSIDSKCCLLFNTKFLCYQDIRYSGCAIAASLFSWRNSCLDALLRADWFLDFLTLFHLNESSKWNRFVIDITYRWILFVNLVIVMFIETNKFYWLLKRQVYKRVFLVLRLRYDSVIFFTI